MKRLKAFVGALICSTLMIASAQEATDTTVRFNQKTVYINDSIGQLTVRVMDENSNEYKKVYEGIFSDEQSYEQFNVMQEIGFHIPFVKKKHTKNKSYKCNYMTPHWAGFGFGFLTLADDNMNIGQTGDIPLNKGKSNEIILNVLEGILPIGGNVFGITSGFGLNWRNFHLDKNSHLLQQDAITKVYDAPAGITYRYSRLRTLHLTIPLLFEWQPRLGRNNRNFYVTAGVVGGWNVMATYRVKYDDATGKKVSILESRGLQTNPLTLDAMIQIGYGCIGFYAKYSPIGVFQKGKGPQVNAASLGCMINF